MNDFRLLQRVLFKGSCLEGLVPPSPLTLTHIHAYAHIHYLSSLSLSRSLDLGLLSELLLVVFVSLLDLMEKSGTLSLALSCPTRPTRGSLSLMPRPRAR